MSGPSFERVKEVLADALERDPSEQLQFVETACAGDRDLLNEVLELLGHADDSSQLSTAPEVRILWEDVAAEAAPEVVGDYRILGLLGQGGMGTVYEAEQSRPNRRVALKLLRPGLLEDERARRRFDLESEWLGRLDHPAIATIHEVGLLQTARGTRPWFAMELVKGQTLDRWALSVDRDPRLVMHLLARVGDGIGAAHRVGIVHRDLKPANVLVDEQGHPRILDFGVARLADRDGQSGAPETDTGQLLGTLEYMSPEQIAGAAAQIDTRTDVYSLGVIGFELLSGDRPFRAQGGLQQLVRAISEGPVPNLRAVAPQLPRDLGLILSRAMAKEADRRYPTVAAFSQDLRRWLERRPVEARAPSAAYTFMRFAARNRALVAVACVAVLAIAGGFFGVLHQARESDRARLVAEAAEGRSALDAQVARESVTYLKDGILAAAHPDALGPLAPVKDVLIHAADSLEQAFQSQPEIEQSLRTTLVEVWLGLGTVERAAADAERIVLLAEQLHGDPSAALGRALRLSAEVAERQSRLEEAEDIARRSVRVLAGSGPAAQAEWANAVTTLAWILRSRGALQEALSWSEQSLAWRRAHFDARHPQIAVGCNDHAVILQDLGRLPEASALLEESLAIRRAVHGEVHTQVAQGRNNLGLMYRDLGRREEAAAEFRAVLSIHEQLGVQQHLRLVATWFNLFLVTEGEEKANALEAAHTMAVAILPEDHFLRFHTAFSLGGKIIWQGAWDRGHAMMLEALGQAIETFGDNHPRVASYRVTLGSRYFEREDWSAAAEQYSQAVAIRNTSFPGPHVLTAYAHLEHGRALRRMQDYPAAERALSRAYEILQKVRKPGHPRRVEAARELVLLCEESARDADRALWATRLGAEEAASTQGVQ